MLFPVLPRPPSPPRELSTFPSNVYLPKLTTSRHDQPSPTLISPSISPIPSASYGARLSSSQSPLSPFLLLLNINPQSYRPVHLHIRNPHQVPPLSSPLVLPPPPPFPRPILFHHRRRLPEITQPFSMPRLQVLAGYRGADLLGV